MNRRDFFKAISALGAVVALHEIEADSSDGLAQTPVESGWKMLGGFTLQWGMTDDTGAAVFPVAMDSVISISVVGDSPVVEELTTTYAITTPRSYWLVMGFL